MIEPVVFDSNTSGPRLLILGAVHGNEKCGTAAIRRVIEEMNSGAIKIARGRVTFVPICNPRAYEADVRFVERNLNRYLVPMEKPDTYEAKLGNILCPLLADCDTLLDLHSYHAGGPPFVFVGTADTKGQEFGSILGDVTLMTGWQEAYAATGRKQTQADTNESTGTTEYARMHGATAVTLECGQHKDPQAPEIAYRAIRNAMLHLNLLNEPATPKPRPTGKKLVTMTQVFYRDDEGRFPKNWKHLDPVVKDEPLALRADGTPIPALDNGVIIMPRADTPLGQEWFYFGVTK